MSKKEFALYIEDLTVSFDGFKAVDDLSFYVDRNEIRVIIGDEDQAHDGARVRVAARSGERID